MINKGSFLNEFRFGSKISKHMPVHKKNVTWCNRWSNILKHFHWLRTLFCNTASCPLLCIAWAVVYYRILCSLDQPLAALMQRHAKTKVKNIYELYGPVWVGNIKTTGFEINPYRMCPFYNKPQPAQWLKWPHFLRCKIKDLQIYPT